MSSNTNSDLYAVVDLSKKRKNKVTDADNESVQKSNSDIPVYSVVHKVKEQDKQQNEDASTMKGRPSTTTLEDQGNICEKNDKNGDRKYYLSNTHFKASLLANKLAIALLVTIIIIIGITTILFIIVFVKVEALESLQTQITQCITNPNNTMKKENPLCSEFEQKLRNAFQLAVSNISFLPKNDSDTNKLSLNMNITPFAALATNITSCADFLRFDPSSSSGYYTFRSSTGQLVSVYCDMTRTCGNITGGWMTVAELDLNYCFTGLKSMSFNGTKTCVVNKDAPGCTSVQFSTFNINYSKVCGKVRGYGVGTVDGYRVKNQSQASEDFLDGVSFNSNGSHIWSFAAGGCSNCDYKPSSIGNDWTCDGTACEAGNFCGMLLWNTSMCGENRYFLKQFASNTNTGITMKVCRNEPRENEDIALSAVELYVH